MRRGAGAEAQVHGAGRASGDVRSAGGRGDHSKVQEWRAKAELGCVPAAKAERDQEPGGNREYEPDPAAAGDCSGALERLLDPVDRGENERAGEPQREQRPSLPARGTAAARQPHQDARERDQPGGRQAWERGIEIAVSVCRQRLRRGVAIADRIAKLVDRRRAGAEQRERTYRQPTALHAHCILGTGVLFGRVQARLAAIVAALALAAPAAALANGDPASDVLLQAKVYFPAQRVSVAAANSLKAVVEKANAKGYAIRVALIKDEADLGTVPNLLNQPQKYSEFLGPEIRFAYKGDLLVVMPNGLGLTTTDETPPPSKAIDGTLVEAGGSPDGLAQTAEEAVAKLAAAAGHPLEGKRRSGGGGAVAGVVVAVLLLALGIAGAFWVRRSQTAAAPREDASTPARPGDTTPPAP